MKYTQSMNGHYLFINSSEGSFTTLLVYVDDIILVGNEEEIDQVKQSLNKTFKINDLGNLRYFLGLGIARSKKGTMMNPRKYAMELSTKACRSFSQQTCSHSY